MNPIDPQKVAEIAKGLGCERDLADLVRGASPPILHPRGKSQIMGGTAAQARRLYLMGVHVGRILTPIGELLKQHLLTPSPEHPTKDHQEQEA